jgi:cell division septation protein DedD
MTRMADPERPRDDSDYDDERFEDEGRRSIFSALWFRAILVVIVLGVVAAVAVPYVLELANQPAPKTTAISKPETSPPPVAPPAPPVASTPPPAPSAPEKSADKPASTDKPSMSDAPPAAPMPTPPAEKPAGAPRKSEGSKSVAKEQPASAPRAPRASAAPSPAGPASGYFVQVGAFKNPDTARKLAVRLREQKYTVEETSAAGVAAPSRPAAPSAPPASAAASDRYDVYISGGTPADINAKLSSRGLNAEPAAGGVVVKPSLPLRDAVALSKDLAVDGLKVQVRRAAGGSAPAPAAPPASASAATSDGMLYRVRVGPFDDKTAATSTLRELEQKGYTPFIARGGQ